MFRKKTLETTTRYQGTDGISSNVTPSTKVSPISSNTLKRQQKAFDSKANEYVIAFLIGKLPFAITKDLCFANKQDATVEEIRNFIPQRSQS